MNLLHGLTPGWSALIVFKGIFSKFTFALILLAGDSDWGFRLIQTSFLDISFYRSIHDFIDDLNEFAAEVL